MPDINPPPPPPPLMAFREPGQGSMDESSGLHIRSLRSFTQLWYNYSPYRSNNYLISDPWTTWHTYHDCPTFTPYPYLSGVQSAKQRSLVWS